MYSGFVCLMLSWVQLRREGELAPGLWESHLEVSMHTPEMNSCLTILSQFYKEQTTMPWDLLTTEDTVFPSAMLMTIKFL